MLHKNKSQGQQSIPTTSPIQNRFNNHSSYISHYVCNLKNNQFCMCTLHNCIKNARQQFQFLNEPHTNISSNNKGVSKHLCTSNNLKTLTINVRVTKTRVLRSPYTKVQRKSSKVYLITNETSATSYAFSFFEFRTIITIIICKPCDESN